MNKLTPSIKKKITSDWMACSPSFSEIAPMRLGRIIGPLLQGICLDRDPSNTAYLPTLHTHNLCKPFPVISLDMGQPLMVESGKGVERISLARHPESHQGAAKRLLASSYLPTVGNVEVRQFLTAVERYQGSGRSDADYPISLFEDAVICWSWTKSLDRAAALIDSYVKQTKSWPEFVFVREGGRAAWIENLRMFAAGGQQLRDTFVSQVEIHKLQNLPVSEMTA